MFKRQLYKEMQVVYGGQWGSEGKGQIAVHLARERVTPWMIAVRVGGPNAGHTFTAVNGQEMKVQQIPCAAFAADKVIPVIGVSGMILPDVFKDELISLSDVWGGSKVRQRVIVDYNASVITPADMRSEKGLKTRIGSTGEGVGSATAKRVMRRGLTFGNWIENLPKSKRQWWDDRVQLDNTQEYLTEAPSLYRDGSLTLQIEGTQGYLLSLNAGRYYPFCTSRDCGPDAIISQCGISPRIANRKRIVCVMRTFPIRVGGNSGPMGEEIDWDTMKQETDGYISQPEITTVTKKQRRIARWSFEISKRVGLETCPTEVALTFADYMYPNLNKAYEKYGPENIRKAMSVSNHNTGLETPYLDSLHRLAQFINDVEESVQAPVTMFSVGPGMIINTDNSRFFNDFLG